MNATSVPLPCPFCGYETPRLCPHEKGAQVLCVGCGCLSGVSQDDAIAVWNRRAPAPPAPAAGMREAATYEVGSGGPIPGYEMCVAGQWESEYHAYACRTHVGRWIDDVQVREPIPPRCATLAELFEPPRAAETRHRLKVLIDDRDKMRNSLRRLTAAAQEVYDDEIGDRDATQYVSSWERLRRALAEAATVPSPCEHDFQANIGMYDTTHRYCTKCGRAE